MYLKSLELFGFKSFPERTSLGFERGATVVVGPNGSGKSNISDAMRWVLGEVSSKSIRGNKMEDVIFGGTDDRKQMNFAEVTITLDNSDRMLDCDFDEVSVTRRYNRRGDSDYFINRRPVRLRDIHELFMNTGVGREGYSIIGQGRIAEIISQKSDERRAIFEEAAGISKYRYKKEEAETKLEDVDANLVRLNDILSELEGRVEPLRVESERARRYLEYYEIKKRDDVSVWLYDFGCLLHDLKLADERLNTARCDLDAASERLNSLEEQNERLFNESQESKYQFELLLRKIEQTNSESHQLDSRIKLTENDISHRKIQLEERARTSSRFDERRDEYARARDDAKQSLDEASGRVVRIAGELKGLEDNLEKLRAERSQLATWLDERLAVQKRGEDRLIELKIRLSVLDNSDRGDVEKARELEAGINRYTDSSALLASRIEKAERVIAEYNSRADKQKAEIERITADIESLKREKQDYIDKANNIWLDYTAKKHRIDAIRRMDELLEGYSQSVRFVMNEYTAGRIDGLSDRRIYGPVSKLITVSPRYTLALETALGANMQNIIVDDETAAKAAINHLKKKNAGCATFYPISSMKPRFSPIPESEAEKYSGYIGSADSLVSCDEKFLGIIRNLLGATLVYDNIDNASTMAKATGYKTRIVTLDGQIINAGGSFTGGSAKRDSGMLTRKSETDKLKSETDELARSLETYKKAQNDCDGKIADKQRELSGLSGQGAMLTSLANAETTQLEVLKSQLENERGLQKSLEDDLSRLRRDADERADGIAKLKAETEDITAENAKISTERSDGVSRLGDFDIQIESLEKKRGELLISRAESGRDSENAAQTLEAAEKRLADAVNEQEENERLTTELADANIRAESELEALKKRLADTTDSLSALMLERAELNEKNVGIEQKLNRMRVQLQEETNRRESCFREFTLAETKQKSLTDERDNQTSRLWDDYELTYSTALECGYPEVTSETRKAAIAELNEYKSKLRELGSVNLAAIDEYAEQKQRFDFMSSQVDDLKRSKVDLQEIIKKLEAEMCETFANAMEEIDRNFKLVFAELFGGGTAELVLTEPDDLLSSGIEIRVAPPGKIIKSLTLLSGGEQAFVAIALIFAILRVNPTPFCVFDEIEAALDEANVFRFADYLKRYSDTTQFIVITHRRGTMEIADRIYGVTMQERGISKVLMLDVNSAAEQANLGQTAQNVHKSDE